MTVFVYSNFTPAAFVELLRTNYYHLFNLSLQCEKFTVASIVPLEGSLSLSACRKKIPEREQRKND